MESLISSNKLRIVNRINEYNKYGYIPYIKDIVDVLKDYQTESTVKTEIKELESNKIIDIKNNKIFINKKTDEYNWYNYLLKIKKNIIVLGMPGNHTIEFVKNLNKKKVMYIDHDVAWKSLINYSTNKIRIISPFPDKTGFKIFGPSIIEALKKNVKVEMITRSIGPFSKESHRRKAFKNFIKHVLDELSKPDLSIYHLHDGIISEEIATHLGSIHAKVIMQDNKAVYVGSGEFRGNSISKNVEIGNIFTDEEYIQNINNIVESVKEISLFIDWRELL
jgi:hypothetical protein